MMLLDVLAWCLVLPVAIMLLVLVAELLLFFVPKGTAPAGAARSGDTIILMPAHNEEKGIATVLTALAPHLSSDTRVLVVADNCSDDTAAIARASGAEVLERHDLSQTGKGHALAFGRDFLCANPPECVIILDADCWAEEGAIALLAQEAARHHVPVQACYLMQPEMEQGPLVQISNFAFLVKNLVRQGGTARIGVPAVLTGTGMAFPWPVFETAPLASSSLVEDLELGIALTRAGSPPRFLGSAQIWSVAAARDDTLSQRTRWEHGYIHTAHRSSLPLMATAVRRMSPRLFWLALDLLVPPLAMLMALSGLIVLAALLLWMAGGGIAPALFLGGLIGATVMVLALVWAVAGREMVSGASLLRIPGYVLWKIPVYLNLLRKRQTEWIRTRRSGE